jgi:hypothetical protein
LRLRTFAITFALLAFTLGAHSQAAPTASRTLELSTFGGFTGNFTGLDGGKNLSIMAGVDLGLPPFFKIYPTAEFRGMYPIHDGTIDSQKNALGGLKFEKHYGHLRAYGDVLFGRGEIDYVGGYPSPTGNFLYASTTSNVLSPGAGVTYYASDQIAFFADVQFQHYNTPVTSSGSLWSTPVSVGMVYRFNFERHGNPGPYNIK